MVSARRAGSVCWALEPGRRVGRGYLRSIAHPFDIVKRPMVRGSLLLGSARQTGKSRIVIAFGAARLTIALHESVGQRVADRFATRRESDRFGAALADLSSPARPHASHPALTSARMLGI